MEWYWWVILVVVSVGTWEHYQTKWRKQRLMEKYNDINLVNKLMKKLFWIGQTEGQLVDSIGKPLDIDQKVLKTKIKEVWKYNSTGKNRYGLRITIENGEVVGWDKK